MNIPAELTKLIKNECDAAIQYGIYGTQEFHIESIEKIENKGKALNFKVTTWNDISEDPRKTREMSLFEIMDLLGRIIGHRATSDGVGLFK
jgi:hypothetical protein